MVGPVNGAAAQQVAIANPFQQQQGQSEVRERQPEQNRPQPAGAAAAETQSAENNEQNTQQLAAAGNTGQNTQRAGGEQERGSLLDISV